MKLKNLLMACLMAALSFPVFSQDLLISGIFDATLSGGTPKGVELYVVNDIPDLSLYGIGTSFNAGTSSGADFTFPAAAVTAGTYIYCTANDSEFDTFFGFSETYIVSALTINGDDTVELFFNGNLIDVYGSVGTDGSGEPWEYTNSWSYRVDGTSASTTWTAADWIVAGTNVFNGAATNAEATPSMPVGTYSNSSSAVPGCTDVNACNYDNNATVDNGSCEQIGDSCDDQDASTVNDVYQSNCSCAGVTEVLGCTDSGACNFNSGATTDDGSCDFSCIGCTNPLACNYDVAFTIDNGSCGFVGDSCDDMDPATFSDEYQPDCSCAGTVPVLTNSLIITAVFDGPLSGGTPKGVELYAINTISDLSTFGIGSANNGEGTDGLEFTFPADNITAGTYIFVSSDDSGAQTFFASSAANYNAGSTMGINGDDAVELYEFGQVIDVFGDINTDGTGESWEHLDSWAHRNCEQTPNAGVFDASNWSFGGVNVFDGTTLNTEASNPMPVAAFETTCPTVVPGCTNLVACNYNENATTDDGSCELIGDSCDDGDNLTENDVLQNDCSCAGTAVTVCDPALVWNAVDVTTNSGTTGGSWGESTPGEYNVNGFCGGSCAEAVDTWLISNGYDFSSVTTSNLLFDLSENFGFTSLDLQYALDYTGDPAAATWVSLGTFDTAGAYNVDLAALTGQAQVHLGFQYADDGADGYSSFTLTNVNTTGDCAVDFTVYDCQAEQANFGDECDDADASTINDVIQNDCSCAGETFTLTNDLIITAVYDGPLDGGSPKGIELYVVNDIADLSTFGLGSANNGGGTDGEEFTFPADAVTAGTFIYITSGALTEFNTFFGFDATYDGGSTVSINGDDAIELFEFGQVIDTFGDINTDGSGETWEYTDGWAYRNCETGPDGATFVEANWTFSGVDALEGESDNSTATNPIPAGSFLTTCAAPVLGCTDDTATNYNPLATQDDGSCTYDNGTGGCTHPLSYNYDAAATTDDGSCDPWCIGDLNGDRDVDINDFLIYQPVFGTSCPE